MDAVCIAAPCHGLPSRFDLLRHAAKGVALGCQDDHIHLGVHLGRIRLHVHVPMGISVPVFSLPNVVCHET